MFVCYTIRMYNETTKNNFFTMRFISDERELLADICKYDHLPNISEAIRAAVQEYHTRHILNRQIETNEPPAPAAG